jgi:hypothetical protein
MGVLKKSLIFLLSALLTLEALACPVFSITFREPEDIAVSSVVPVSVSYEIPVYQKGMSFSTWSPDAFGTSESDESLARLAETNTEWIALCLSWLQSNTTSHDINPDPNRTPTMDSIEHAIAEAHSLGLKVLLKPMVDTYEEEKTQGYATVWRGEIQPSTGWFAAYSDFINFFAEFAEENDVDLFSVGCEFKATTGEKAQWEQVISGVRARYSGPITYAADWTNYMNIEWWDSVDYVGIDAYFLLSLFNNDPTLEQLKNTWNSYADEIEMWLSTVNKPVIFTEIGYRSGDGTNVAPSNYWSDMDVDLQEQRDCYEAAFQALWNRNWFYGFYWWTWTHEPTDGGPDDSSHTPQNKPAQDLVTQWYSKTRQVAIIDQTYTSATKCSINEVQSVGFHARWENDGADVADARIYVNGTEHVTNSSGWTTFTATYDTVGKRSWVVTDLQHSEATGYTVAVEVPSIVWDKVSFETEVDSASFGALNVRVKIAYAYDGTSVTGATTAVNGEPCNEIEAGIYETEIASWSPFEQLTVTADAAGLLDETWTTSTFHVMNTVLYLALAVAAVILLVFLLKRLKAH